MEEDKFKEMFIKYAQELLAVNVEECGGGWDGRYVAVSLELDGEAINTVHFDLPTN